VAKKQTSKNTYYSKVLLFGEHIINKGARGLAIPCEQYSGRFSFDLDKENEEAIASNKSIVALTHYLIHHPELSKLYNTNALLNDLEKGLYFDSNIPQGYGMGSSGALVAGLCKEYRNKQIALNDLTLVKHELALLESDFHGKSSGLDPLVCFLNKSVIIEQGEVSRVFDLPKSKDAQLKIFLINTEIPRSTAPFVKLFLEKTKDAKFEHILQESLIKANDICIDSLLAKKYVPFWKSLKIIAQLQHDLLPEFIPERFRSVWKQGIVNNEFYLKICGAGGGGLILGFCKIETDIRSVLHQYDVIELQAF